MSAARAPAAALDGLTVLERGWLSSNNVLLHGAPGEGATLVDSAHCTHAAQTVALVRHALAGEALQRIVNTHLHSDHCGGNAALQQAFPGLPVDVPAGEFDAARRWDEDALSYRATNQRCVRFAVRGRVEAGSRISVGRRTWEVIAAPGHDPQALMLFDATHGVLVSADALWENGLRRRLPRARRRVRLRRRGCSARHDRAPAGRARDPRPRRTLHRRRRRTGARTQPPGQLARGARQARAPRRQGAGQVPPDGGARAGAHRAASLAAATPLLQRLHERIGRTEAAEPGAWGCDWRAS